MPWVLGPLGTNDMDLIFSLTGKVVVYGLAALFLFVVFLHIIDNILEKLEGRKNKTKTEEPIVEENQGEVKVPFDTNVTLGLKKNKQGRFYIERKIPEVGHTMRLWVSKKYAQDHENHCFLFHLSLKKYLLNRGLQTIYPLCILQCSQYHQHQDQDVCGHPM